MGEILGSLINVKKKNNLFATIEQSNLLGVKDSEKPTHFIR